MMMRRQGRRRQDARAPKAGRLMDDKVACAGGRVIHDHTVRRLSGRAPTRRDSDMSISNGRLSVVVDLLQGQEVPRGDSRCELDYRVASARPIKLWGPIANFNVLPWYANVVQNPARLAGTAVFAGRTAFRSRIHFKTSACHLGLSASVIVRPSPCPRPCPPPHLTRHVRFRSLDLPPKSPHVDISKQKNINA